MTPALKLAMKGFIASAVLAAGLETIVDATMYSDHKWAFYVFGMDFLLLVLFLLQAVRQERVNKSFVSCPGVDSSWHRKILDRVSKLEAVADERRHRIETLEKSSKLRIRQVATLRDIAENQEKRLESVEKMLKIAHDKAVARLALRGSVFTEEE